MSSQAACSIYWLIDARPATLREYPTGRVRYCGNTSHAIEKRVDEHRWHANTYPRHALSQWIISVGQHLRVHVVEVVPAGADWRARKRHWVKVSRFSFPEMLNVADGGRGGDSGRKHSDESRARMSKSQRGLKRSPETRARIAAAVRGRHWTLSDKTRAALSARMMGNKIAVSAKSLVKQKMAEKRRDNVVRRKAKRLAYTLSYHVAFATRRYRAQCAALADICYHITSRL